MGGAVQWGGGINSEDCGMKSYKGIPTYPCPHNRELTDAELERIRFAGEKMLAADQRDGEPPIGEDWKAK